MLFSCGFSEIFKNTFSYRTPAMAASVNVLDLNELFKGSFSTCKNSCPEVFLEISKNSQENTCARDSFLIKLQAWALQFY